MRHTSLDSPKNFLKHRRFLVFLLLLISSGLAQAEGLNTDPSKSYLDPFKKTLQNAHREKIKAVENPQELQNVVTRLALPGAVRRKYASRLRRETPDFFLQNTIRQIQKWETKDTGKFPDLRQRAGRGTMKRFEAIRTDDETTR